jgi:hypothetical protein
MTHWIDLASEPFNEIISNLNTRDCTALWLSGDSKMQWKLSIGKAIREINIEWTRSSRCLWPSHLVLLAGLESFRLNCSRKLPTRHSNADFLATLPRNLKELVLNFGSSAIAFQTHLTSSGSHFIHLETLYLTIGSDLKELELEIPRTVTNLTITSKRRSKIVLPLSSLPSGLIHLTCQLNMLEIGTLRFPTSIKTLDLSMSLGDWTFIAAMKGLKQLFILGLEDLEVSAVQLLPRSIERLRLEFQMWEVDESWWVEILKAMPSNLKQISGFPSFHHMTAPIAKILPRTLDTITSAIISPDAISHLPQKIQTLNLGSIVGLGNISAFPATIQTLRLPMLSTELADKLPPLLQALWLYNHEHGLGITHRLVDRLPRNLTSLSAVLREDSNLALLFNALPPKISFLSLRTCSVEGEFETIQTPSNSSLHLPTSLATIDLGFLDFLSDVSMEEWVLGLPTTLRDLKLHVKHLQKGGITSLSRLTNLNSLSLTVLNSPKGGWAGHLDLGSLPRKMVELSFYDQEMEIDDDDDDVSRTDITNESFVGAPLSIRSLRLPNSPLLTKDLLIHPPHLDEFYMSFRKNKPSWFRDRDD